MITEGPWDEEGGADNMWVKMETCIQKVAKEVLGETKGKKHEAKTYGGGMWMSKGLSRRRSATRVGTTIEAQATW